MRDSAQLDRVQRHWESLQLANQHAYFRWCRDNGFPESTSKRSRQLTRERDHFVERQAAGENQVSLSNAKIRSPKFLLELISPNKDSSVWKSPHLTHQIFGRYARKLFRHQKSGRASLDALLEHCISRRCRFLDHRERWRGAVTDESLDHVRPGQETSLGFLGALTLIAKHSNSWRRPLKAWKPTSRNATRQFRSLLRHLFVEHEPLPEFFDRAWLEGRMQSVQLSATSVAHREWYRQLGAGQNLRKCHLPIPCTKKMAFYILQAPAESSMSEAIVWGQLRALGADDRLADAIAVMPAVADWQENKFWLSVFRWLIEQPMLDTRQVGPIIDYIHQRRFVPEQILLADGRIGLGVPAEPGLSMRGRTVDTLLRRVESWHLSLAKQKRHSARNWATIGLPALNLREGDPKFGNSKLWKIRELTSGSELTEEGRKLKHCVASYAQSCAQQRSSIWTMELQKSEGTEKLLTIEVRPGAHAIVQIRGRYNRLPTEQERRIIRLWAQQAKLSVSKRLA